MKTFGLLAAVLLVGTTQAWAEEAQPRVSSSQFVTTALLLSRPDQMLTPIPVHSSWRFVGCAYTPHECHHRAHNYGYMDYTARHDHYTCHHGPSYACYAR